MRLICFCINVEIFERLCEYVLVVNSGLIVRRNDVFVLVWKYTCTCSNVFNFPKRRESAMLKVRSVIHLCNVR